MSSFDLTPHSPRRVLIWSDRILDLQDLLVDWEHPVYIVGGAVRDAYLHRPVHDLDLVTSGSAKALARHLANLLEGDVFVLDAERDVARVLLDEALTIDVAAFRAESLLLDLQDRDFTLNAMAVDLRGDLNLLIDPLGGEDDITLRQLRQCSSQAISKDVIRALRAVRQSTQLTFRIEPETLQAVRANAPRLKETSGERIRDELMKLLQLPKVSGALRVADRVGLLSAIVPELAELHSTPSEGSPLSTHWEHTLLVIDKLLALFSTVSFKRTDATAATFEMGMIVMVFDRFRTQLNGHFDTVWADGRLYTPLLTLAALLHDIGENDRASAESAERVADELRLSNAEKERLTLSIRHHRHPVFEESVTPLAAHRFWYPLREVGIDVIFLAMANFLGTKAHTLNQDEWLLRVERSGALLEAYYLRHEEIVAPRPLLDGNQLKNLFQLKPGPLIGELLTLLRESQVEGRVHTEEDALSVVRAHLQQ